VGATEAVRALLIRASSDWGCILLISEDLDEILMLADRIAVIYEGRSSASSTVERPTSTSWA